MFVGIHPAGAKPEALRKFVKKHGWPHLGAIDRGKPPVSETFFRYGIPHLNQLVVVSHDGLVAYNGWKPTQTKGSGSQVLVQLAKELGVKYPHVDGVPAAKRLEIEMKIVTLLYSKEIDAALAKKK